MQTQIVVKTRDGKKYNTNSVITFTGMAVKFQDADDKLLTGIPVAEVEAIYTEEVAGQ